MFGGTEDSSPIPKSVSRCQKLPRHGTAKEVAETRAAPPRYDTVADYLAVELSTARSSRAGSGAAELENRARCSVTAV